MSEYINPWGSGRLGVAAVGTEPRPAHEDLDSTAVFGLDMDTRITSGLVLERVFGELDVSLDDVYWTNAFKRTRERRDGDIEDLRRELRPYRLVIALGNETVDVMDENDVQYDQKLWHPAYIARNESRFQAYVDRWRQALSPPDGQLALDSFG